MEQICVLAAHLSDLLYLGPSFPDERATLAGRDDQPQGDWWLGADGAIGHQCSQVLEGDMGKEKCGESQQERKRERGSPRGKDQTAGVKVEMDGEISHLRVLTPSISPEQALDLRSSFN